jgi:hypothetical protein
MNPVKQVHVGDESWDTLDGGAIKEGEVLQVRWPTGKVTTEMCLLDRGRHERAYVNLTLAAGLLARVDLRQDGVMCERPRLPSASSSVDKDTVDLADGVTPEPLADAQAARDIHAAPRPGFTDTPSKLRLLARYMHGEESTFKMLMDAADEIEAARRAP